MEGFENRKSAKYDDMLWNYDTCEKHVVEGDLIPLQSCWKLN